MTTSGAGSWLVPSLAEAKHIVADAIESSLDLADLVMGRHYC